MSTRGRCLVLVSAALLVLGVAPAVADSTGAAAPESGVFTAEAAAPSFARSTSTTPSTPSPTLPSSTTSTGASSASPSGRATRRPAPVLPRRLRGHAAVRALGTNLGRVATINHLSPSRLTSLLTHDHTAWLSTEGRLFYQEDAVAQDTTSPTTAATTVAPAYPTSETFALHSLPGATRTIFLDFAGATVTDSGWNGTGTNQIANGTHIGFDLDGSPSTFNTAEHGFIQEVWRQVAEIYSPFNVDVTTADPGPDGIARSSSADTSYGTHVVITSSPTPRAQVCGGCLGVAYVGTFGLTDPGAYYQPAWVFAYSKSFDPMIVAQAAAHETGHTLGLHHDGTTAAPYFQGTAAWGPIMGSSMNRAVSQFSQGEYATANNTEDDFAVIQANGLPLREDDYGNTPATADQLVTHASYDVSGVISTRTDTDVLAMTMPCQSPLTVSVTGIGAHTALDLKLDVLDPTGTVVATSSPVSSYAGPVPVSQGMDAQVSIPNATGAYYLRVDGVGNGNPAGAGWSDYGSLGQWHLSATTTCTEPTDLGSTTTPPAPTPTSTPTPTLTPTPTPTTPVAPPTPAAKPLLAGPSAPRIATPSPGRRGGARTAVARWSMPASSGGAAITRYRVVALLLGSHNRVVLSRVSTYQRPTARSVTMALPAGRYVFKVMAWNRVGASRWSAASRVVTPR